MEKQLGQACNLGAAESLGISKVCQTVLASLMESEIWHKLAGSVTLWGESLEKGQWPLLTPMPDTSVSPSIPLVPFKLPFQCWSSEGVSLSGCLEIARSGQTVTPILWLLLITEDSCCLFNRI